MLESGRTQSIRFTALLHLLDNITWHTLSGPHRPLSLGTDTARRYAPGFSGILGFANPQNPDFRSLAPFCELEEPLYTDGWSGRCPPDWTLELDSVMLKMVWGGETPEEEADPDIIALGPEQAACAMELATLTRPGPFGPRTIELGDYFGIFEGQRLIAMAGERMAAGNFREISGVCTHPDWQGKGLAPRLMRHLLHREIGREEIPFLHVMKANAHAIRLYERMGFRVYCESPVRITARIR